MLKRRSLVESVLHFEFPRRLEKKMGAMQLILRCPPLLPGLDSGGALLGREL